MVQPKSLVLLRIMSFGSAYNYFLVDSARSHKDTNGLRSKTVDCCLN